VKKVLIFLNCLGSQVPERHLHRCATGFLSCLFARLMKLANYITSSCLQCIVLLAEMIFFFKSYFLIKVQTIVYRSVKRGRM